MSMGFSEPGSSGYTHNIIVEHSDLIIAFLCNINTYYFDYGLNDSELVLGCLVVIFA